MASERSTVRIGDLMTRRVHGVAQNDSVEAVASLLEREHCHHVPVLDDGCPIGIISARDLIRLAATAKPGEKQESFTKARARDIMSTPVETISEDAYVDDAISRIGEGDLHALVVTDDAGSLTGIVTHRDLLQYLMG